MSTLVNMQKLEACKRYIAVRGLLPFTQRPEYCECMNCFNRRRDDDRMDGIQRVLRAFPQLIKETA